MSPKPIVDFYDDQCHADGDPQLCAGQMLPMYVWKFGLTTAATIVQSSHPMFLTTHFLTIIRRPTTRSASTVNTIAMTMMPGCLFSSPNGGAVVVSMAWIRL